MWKGNNLYVTASVLAHAAPVSEGQKKPALESGVYRFSLEELNGQKVMLSAYSQAGSDSHLIVKSRSTHRIGFGADGITFDDDGNLYTSIMEDGRPYRSTFDVRRKRSGCRN